MSNNRAIIARPFTFQVLFTDGDARPIAVTDATISIFYYDNTTREKITLVDAASLVASVPSETGRYVYAYTIPGTFLDGDVLYAEMRATDPISTLSVVVDQNLDLAAALSSTGRMTSRFVK